MSWSTHHHLIPHKLVIIIAMRNELIPPKNLLDELMIHHLMKDGVCPQTKQRTINPPYKWGESTSRGSHGMMDFLVSNPAGIWGYIYIYIYI